MTALEIFGLATPVMLFLICDLGALWLAAQ